MSVTQTSGQQQQNIHDEYDYLYLIANVLSFGNARGDRTGTGTLSIFAPQNLRFNLNDNVLPLLTTKRVFFRGVLEELLWFVNGKTNSNELSEKGVHIWDGNGSREFLDKLGFHDRPQGDLGPVYGFQWRHFGAKYVDSNTDYTNQGVDQLKSVIDTIKNNPWDRRIILSAWNPADIPQMALPPCHLMAQFYVTPSENKNKLSCLLYQRSADLGLGIPFNIASYALLTHMIAYMTNTEAHELVIQLGDAHVYKNHIDALKLQLERKPKQFPTLKFKRRADEIKSIDGFQYHDFIVENYEPHPRIPVSDTINEKCMSLTKYNNNTDGNVSITREYCTNCKNIFINFLL